MGGHWQAYMGATPGARGSYPGCRDPLVDQLAVELALKGTFTRLTHHELRIAIDKLDGPGATALQVARTLHVSVRTVQRHRARRRSMAS